MSESTAAAPPKGMDSDGESKTEATLEEEIYLLSTYNVMRSKYEEKVEGNALLKTEKDKAARLIALGTSITGEDRKKLADIYNNLYRLDALKALLCVNHPHHLKENLSKADIIQGIIDAVLGEWNSIMQKYDELRIKRTKLVTTVKKKRTRPKHPDTPHHQCLQRKRWW